MFKEETIKKFRTIPTPFYYYDMDLLRQTLSSCSGEAGKYGYFLHYALKANSNPADPVFYQQIRLWRRLCKR